MLIPITNEIMINSERIDYVERKGQVVWVFVNGKKHQVLMPLEDFVREFDKSEKHKQFFAG